MIWNGRYEVSAYRPRERVDHGARSKSLLRLLLCLCWDSGWNCGNRSGCFTIWGFAEMKIRRATEADRDAIWNIFHEVVASGDTYALDPHMSREDALAYWFAPGTHTYVAEQPTVGIAGTYILRPNQSGGGSHVAN